MQEQFNSFNVGIDVSKDFLDVCLVGPVAPRHWRVRQQLAALDQLAQELLRFAPERVVLEATGGYESDLVQALEQVGLPAVVMNPKRIRDFAKSEGLLAKNDRLDAYAMALFAAKSRPRLRAPVSPQQRELGRLTAYQQKMVADRAALKVQLQRAQQEILQDSLVRRIEQLDAECLLLEAEIDNRIAASTEWSLRAALAKTAPGVGMQVARTIVAELPELGALSDRAAAALAGLAPFADESGKYHGRRHIRGGRKRLRRMLYMAAVTAANRDPGYVDFYQRLLSRGKSKKAALIAVARKLLVVLNHMFCHHSPWKSRFAS